MVEEMTNLSTKDEDARNRDCVTLRALLELQVAMDNSEDIEKLSFVFVDAFDLNVEESQR